MTGYVRTDVSNNIADGNIVNASDLDNEFNGVEAAFHKTTGHTHDGSDAEGAPITKVGPTQDVVISASAVTPKTNNQVDLGSSLLQFKDLYIDGTANIDSLVADTADINGGTIDGATIATSNITVGSGKTLDVSAGTLTLADNQISGDKVEGGTINATTITTLTSTTGNITTVNATTVDTTNLEVTNIKAKDGTASITLADSTGVASFTANPVMSGGTANGVAYLNGSKVVTTGSALTFDGTTLVASNLTDSSLTTGRVVYTTTGGNLTDSANLQYSGTDLTVYGITVGRGAGAVSTNTAVGASALAANTTGSINTAVGYAALTVNTTGINNAGFGNQALTSNTTGSSNAAFGYASLFLNTTGGSNTAMGVGALLSNTTASNNTAVGYQAGYSNTTGTNLVAIGFQAGYGNTTANNNIAIGYQAQQVTSTGANNVAVGTIALALNTTGASNIAIGTQALYSNTTASNNTAVGYQAGYSNTTGARNSAFGVQALYSNTTGAPNNAFGLQALYSNTTGAFNSAFGGGDNLTTNPALGANTTGSYNSAFGVGALGFNTTASNNTAVGYQAGYSNTTGTGQTFLGTNAGRATTTGDYNTAIGFGALRVNTTGVGNTIVGCGAGDLLTGSYNTIIGPFVSGVAGAGDLMTTGSKNTILGRYNGNQGGLDIRTASNYIVLSDGDGNPRWINDGTDNWGSGVDPSNWVSGFRAIELTNAVALWSQDSTPSSWLTVNAYYDGAWKYKTSAAFSGYNQSGGYHTWYSSASGSANATFTPTQVLATVQGSSLALQGANPQVGTGITFPATQSASSDANTLDDYEEGTWTPAWSGSGTTTYDSGTTAGRYVKVGKICTAWGIVTSTSLTASGSLVRITLPFNVNNSQANFGSVFVFCENGINPSGGAGNVAGINRINDNTIDLYTVSSSTGANYTQLTYNDLQASSTSRIRFTTTFEVA